MPTDVFHIGNDLERVTLTYPNSPLSYESMVELEDWIKGFLRRAKHRAERTAIEKGTGS